MTPEERRAARIETGIRETRRVAKSPEARELARRTGGKHGTWTREDEDRLRKGEVETPGGVFRFRKLPERAPK